MKIRDILAKGRPAVSFEVFPPRKDAPFGPVKDAVAKLAKERPAFISVTYGASGNAQANTGEIASFVQKCGVPALAHLTCLTATRESIEKEAYALRGAGIENVLCLRGDQPKDACETPPGSFPHAVSVELAQETEMKGITCFGRASGVNGRVKDCVVETSLDGRTWTERARATLANTADAQDVRFPAPVKARFFRFTALNNHYGDDFASMAEIVVIK